MTDFSRLFRTGIKLIDSLTKSLQVTVTHYAWIGVDAYGQPQFASTGIERLAIVNMRDRAIRKENREDVIERALIVFLTPIAPHGATGRNEPIDKRDKIILPDGSTGSILSAEGVSDPNSVYANQSYHYEVVLGHGRGEPTA